jgi:cell wall assembly regulator SMI1
MWLRQHASHILDSLNAGASEDEIKALQSRFGASLPKELVAFYRVHNGQPVNSSGLFFGLRFMPVADVLRKHDAWSELLDMNEELEEHKKETSQSGSRGFSCRKSSRRKSNLYFGREGV